MNRTEEVTSEYYKKRKELERISGLRVQVFQDFRPFEPSGVYRITGSRGELPLIVSTHKVFSRAVRGFKNAAGRLREANII